MKPYMLMWCIGIFLYSAWSFVLSFIVGLVGRNVTAGIMSGSQRAVVMGTITSLGVYAVLIVLVAIGIYVGVKATTYAQMDLKQTLFRAFMIRGLEANQSGHSGEGIAAINTEANTATDLYWNVIINLLLRPIIVSLLSIITLFVVDIRVGVAALCLGVIAYFSQHTFIKPIAKIGKERLTANADAVKGISDIFQGAIPIRAFNLQDKTLEDTNDVMNVLKLLNFKQGFLNMWQRMFTTTMGLISLAVGFGFGGYLVATGQMDFPYLLLIVPILENFVDACSSFGQGLAGMQPPIEAAKRVFAIIDNVPVSEDKGDMDFDGSTLNIKGLNFKYQNTEENTLHDINLEINIGEMVAFVGESGSGKSTMLRIITGFYEREHMGMTLGGTSSEAASIAAWRKNFAYVDQSCKLFDMTIKENIAMGCGGDANETNIVKAAKQAFAHDFINQLEQKYDSPCGEKGSVLSGGQKQRIAIARALIKGSPILVFDEATAALDADSERYVMDSIQSLRSNHTILITTHNLNNIVSADKIVVMNKGRIVEIGKHEELISKKGVYFDLYNINTDDFRD